MFKVRTLTVGAELVFGDREQWARQIAAATSLLKEAKTGVEAVGLEVQTTRLVTNSFEVCETVARQTLRYRLHGCDDFSHVGLDLGNRSCRTQTKSVPVKYRIYYRYHRDPLNLAVCPRWPFSTV